jgi:hypothetical protein
MLAYSALWNKLLNLAFQKAYEDRSPVRMGKCGVRSQGEAHERA